MNSPAPLLRAVLPSVAACLDAFRPRVATFIEIVMDQPATRRETGMQRSSRGAARFAVGFVRARFTRGFGFVVAISTALDQGFARVGDAIYEAGAAAAHAWGLASERTLPHTLAALQLARASRRSMAFVAGRQTRAGRRGCGLAGVAFRICLAGRVGGADQPLAALEARSRRLARCFEARHRLAAAFRHAAPILDRHSATPTWAAPWTQRKCRQSDAHY
jgi:hypothetical protein